MNNTASIPLTTCPNHGNPNLCCGPAKWSDIVVFYLGNYAAHAATTRLIPGQDMLSLSGATAILGALLFPTSGVGRGFDAIISKAICAKTALQMAARSGALLMVIHDPDYFKSERDGEQTKHGEQTKRESPYDESKIHGRCVLPPGYRLVPVPYNAEFENDEPQFHTFWQWLTKLFGRSSDRDITISCSYNAGKALVALGQALFAISTLYETQGDQIARYGYAAFGLTVAPYAWMSTINLVGSLICPEYSAMYLVESQASRRLRSEVEIYSGQHGFPLLPNRPEIQLDGFVGVLANEEDFVIQTRDEWARMKASIIPLIGAAFPLLIYGILSKFQKGESTHAQRSWVMVWLVFGIIVGGALVSTPFITRYREFTILSLGMCAFYSAPAIGGFVVVGQMIHDYGVCTQIT